MLNAKVQDDSTSQQSQVVSSFNVNFIMVKLREHAMCNSLTAAVTGEIAFHLLCTMTIHVIHQQQLLVKMQKNKANTIVLQEPMPPHGVGP